MQAKSRLREKLSIEIDKIRRNAHAIITKAWFEDIQPIEEEGYTRLQAVRSLLISLANVERSLAIDYNHAHSSICLSLLNESLALSEGEETLSADKVSIARTPGKSWALISAMASKPAVYCEAVDRLGMKERFNVLRFALPEKLNDKVFSVLGFFHVKKRISIEVLDDYNQAIAYIDKKGLTPEEFNSLELTEQLLNIHFLQSNL